MIYREKHQLTGKLKDKDIDQMAKCIKTTSRRDGNLDESVMDFNKALTNALNNTGTITD